jgi:hypothetical protein
MIKNVKIAAHLEMTIINRTLHLNIKSKTTIYIVLYQLLTHLRAGLEERLDYHMEVNYF